MRGAKGASTGTASTSGAPGRISGAVFQALRTSAGYTQDQLAETLGTTSETIRRWEDGRRPLARVTAEDRWRHDQVLLAAGAPPELVGLLPDAVRADLIHAELSKDTTSPLHPLSTLVPGRDLTELLSWPISGAPPRILRGHHVQSDRVRLPREERAALAHSLLSAAETADSDSEHGAMVRRQATYFAAQDDPAISDHRPPQITGGDGWSPLWPVARSQSISAAVGGNLDPLHQFVHEGLQSEQNRHANLTYWAYWVGEVPVLWRSDSQMLSTPIDAWPGNKLLDTLVAGVQNAPYRELCAASLHSLVERKPHLAATNHARLATAITNALDVDDGSLTQPTRSKLEQVAYLVRSILK